MTELRNQTTTPGPPGQENRRTSVQKRRPGAALSWNAWVGLLFVGSSLAAVAVIPPLMDRRTRAIEDEMSGVLEPAAQLAGQLESALIQEMVALQGFLLSGDSRFRQAYRQAHGSEKPVRARLGALAEPLDLAIRQRLEWDDAVFQWHQHHAAVLEGFVDRSSFSVAEAQSRYVAVMRANAALREAIAAEIRRGDVRLRAADRRQRAITMVLVGLALFATIVVAVLARLLRSLAEKAEGRRGEAVRVRREIDAVLEATGDGVVGVDLSGRCTFLNRNGANLLGVSPRRALGRDVHEMVHGGPGGLRCEDAGCNLAAALVHREQARILDERLWHGDGHSFPIQCEVRPMLDGRRVRGMVLTFTDLTEIRQAERALQQAVQARDDVVAIVSHDLRGPVATINSAAQLLLEVPLAEEQWREHISAVERSSSRLGLLIKDLLDVNRIEAGAFSVFTRPHATEPLVEAALTLAASSAEAERKSIRVRCESPGDPMPMVRADRQRVLQVFANLLDNAVRHTPAGGQVAVEAQANGTEVVFAVRDSGPGIPPDQRQRVFDRFRQLDAAGVGAGLGLAIVKGIVEAHGGRVWVESEEGVGSAFFFTLPVAAEE